MGLGGGSSINARGGLCLLLSPFPSWSAPSRCEFVSVHAQKGEISLILWLLPPWVGVWVGCLDISHRGHPSNGPYPSSSQQALSTPSLTYLSPCPARIISLSLQLLILFQRFYAQSRGLVMAFLLKFQCCPSFSIIRSLCCLSSRF